MAKIRVELDSVFCKNTEDVTGPDEFYLLGAAVTSDPNQSKGILTTPISINDGETRDYWTFGSGEAILYRGDLPDDQSVVLKLKAYDEDAAHDWNQRPFWVDQMTEVVKGAVQSFGFYGALASLSIDALILIVSSDKDDRIGTTEIEVPVTGQDNEVKQWHFSRSGWWTGRDYTITLLIRRGDVPERKLTSPEHHEMTHPIHHPGHPPILVP